jgi:hypothetical protein
MNDRPRSVEIRREAEFWNLCWQSVPMYRFLTPVGRCRSLRCVVDRLKQLNVGLSELGDVSARMDLVRNVEWFQHCLDLARTFDWARFEGSVLGADPIRLRIVNQIERGECPGATWYIADGVHRTLAAAVLLDQQRIRWRPFTAMTVGDDL